MSRGCPGHPRVKMKMKIDIVTRENKILTHDLNEKDPTIILPFNIEENTNVTKFTVFFQPSQIY